MSINKNLCLPDNVIHATRIQFRYNMKTFTVELRHSFTVRNMKEMPVFVKSSELHCSSVTNNCTP